MNSEQSPTCSAPQASESPAVQPTSPKTIGTIQDAKDKFRRAGDETMGYRNLVTFLIDSGFDKPFQNDSYFDALVLTEAMFDRTHQSMRLLTGAAADGFLEELQQPFRYALERIKKTGGKARMIVLSDKVVPNRFLEQMATDFGAALEINHAKPIAKLNHFIVCDSHIIRYEEPHGELTNGSMANEVKAMVHFNNRSIGLTLESFFDAVWASPI